MSLTLYSFSGSCGLASNIVLEWTGAPYKLELLQKDQLHTDQFYRINPMGKVPVLLVDDWPLDENAAVLNYLAAAYPDARLAGEGPKGLADVNRWLGLVNSEIHPAYKPLFGATAYLEDDAVIEKTKTHARSQLRKLFTLCDEQLGKHDYLAGQRSIADAYLFVTLLWSHMTNVDTGGLDNLARYETRMRADVGVQAALKAQQLDKS